MTEAPIVKPLRNRGGVIIVLVALSMIVICALLGLALDVGMSFGVKGQLQSAADASALAGADSIYPANPSTPLSSLPSPEFVAAKARTSAFAKQNVVGGSYLKDGNIVSVETGYWNVKQEPAGLQVTTTPKGSCSKTGKACDTSADCLPAEGCMVEDLPAVQVTVRKEVPTFFTRIVGWNYFSPEATATAVIGFPKTARHLFPVAVTKCMVDNYFSQKPMPDPPTPVQIGAPYTPGGGACTSGQWTSLNADRNDVPTMKGLMYGTIPLPPLEIGDDIWIDTGTKDVLFQDIERDFIGRVVEFPVVGDVTLSTNTRTPITGFVFFRILGSTNVPKQILGHFLAYYKDEGDTRPGGPKYNAVTRPMLVK